MKADVSRHYGGLSAEERFRLYVKARARGDEQEERRLVDSCPRETWRRSEEAFVGRLTALRIGVCEVVVPDLRVLLMAVARDRAVLSVTRAAMEQRDRTWEEGTAFGLQMAAKHVPAAQRKKLRELAKGMEPREEEDEVVEELVREKAVSESPFGQKLQEDATKLRAMWDAFGAFCEEDLGLPAAEVLRAFCSEPNATPLLEAVQKETAEAAEDAEDTADWRRILRLGWRSGALGDREAEEELKAMVENERAEETRTAEAVAEGEDR